MLKQWCAAALLMVVGPSVYSGVGTWRNYTSQKDVVAVATDGVSILAASRGGMFSLDGSGTFQVFTNAEGLRTIDLTAIAADGVGNVWTGATSGLIHVFTPSTKSWRYVTDIETTNQANRQINNLSVSGDTVLIATAFGLSVFFVERFQFGDTYSRFGTIPTTLRVEAYDAILFNGIYWIALSGGPGYSHVATASASSPNLLQPSAWSLWTVESNTNVTRTLEVFNGTMYAGSGSGLFRFQGSAWVPVQGLAGQSIIALAAAGNVLFASTSTRKVFSITAQDSVQQYGPDLPYAPTSLIVDAATQSPRVGSLDGGVLMLQGSWNPLFPNGPNSNQFLSVAISEDGAVWGASGFNGNGKGVYRLKGGAWKSFTRANSGLPTDDYYRIARGPDGSVWASSWGAGLLEFPRDVDTVRPEYIYGVNVGMRGLSADTTYIVNSAIATDGSGSVWATVYDPFNNNVMAIKSGTSTWSHRNVKLGSTALRKMHWTDVDYNMTFDGFGTLWATVKEDFVKGLAVFANRAGVSDSIAYLLTTTNGLPSNEIRTIVVDRDNDLWVGTASGIAIILDPSRPTSDGSIARYIPLDGTVINSIAVDAINRKWVATPEGVVLLSPDGTQVLETYTVETTNGKLIHNDVRSIAIDRNGTVYFGTGNGLASLGTTAAEPLDDFADQLHVYPNPFFVPSAGTVTIDGLVENSSIKIMAVDGKVVRDLDTPGGRVGFWDGRDENGESVSTGVYIVVAYSGDKVGKGKIAVIRK